MSAAKAHVWQLLDRPFKDRRQSPESILHDERIKSSKNIKDGIIALDISNGSYNKKGLRFKMLYRPVDKENKIKIRPIFPV